MMKIEHEDNKEKGAFFIEENGTRMAELTYGSAAGVMTIDHTEIDENFRGEGIASDLVAEAVKFARESDLKVKATCPYAKKVVEETPEFQDVLA